MHSFYPLELRQLEEKGPVLRSLGTKNRNNDRYSSELALASENAPGGIHWARDGLSIRNGNKSGTLRSTSEPL